MDVRIIIAVVILLIIALIMLKVKQEKFDGQRINWRYVGPPQIPPVWRSW